MKKQQNKFLLLILLNLVFSILTPLAHASSLSSRLRLEGIVSEDVVVDHRFSRGRWHFKAKANSGHPYFVSYDGSDRKSQKTQFIHRQNFRRLASLNHKRANKPLRVSVIAL